MKNFKKIMIVLWAIVMIASLCLFLNGVLFGRMNLIRYGLVGFSISIPTLIAIAFD